MSIHKTAQNDERHSEEETRRVTRERDKRLFEDEEAAAFDDGERAAAETFGKLRDALAHAKLKRGHQRRNPDR